MAKEVEEKEIKKERLSIVLLIFLIISLFSSGFAIYELLLLSSIETMLRYFVIGLLGFIDLVLIFKVKNFKKRKNKKKKKKNKKNKKIYLVTFMTIYSIICLLVGGLIFYVYGQLSNLNKVYVTYSSSLITMKTSNVNDIEDVKDLTIGILSDKKSPEGYIIPKEIIDEHYLEDENEIVKYDDYHTMLADMYASDLDAMFVSSSYVSMFSGITGYENIENDTKVIISKDKEMKKSDTSESELASSGKSITEPFTILLMGIDSTDEVLNKNAVANGDTLILITFNPKTLNATMLSIPRDSYVPISCWSGKPENKITHAAGYGTDCMMNTIEEYFDVNIDYYAKINFKGLVKLVNAVGGVEVEVPKRLCTDDSSRGQQICINPGKQTLNGEQALVFARDRKSLANGDFGRAEHQQEIIMALVNKIKTINNVGTFTNILNTISNSLDTNLTTKQILSFYNVGKDIVKRSLSSNDAELINIQQLFLQGSGQMIYDERARMVLWNYVPNKQSRNDIVQAMKENLELAEHEEIKEFNFSINEPYEKEVIGSGPYNTGGSYRLLPDFTGDSEAQARATASRLGITVTFNGTGGHVVAQSFPANKRLDLMRGPLVLTLSGKEEKKDTTIKKEEIVEEEETTEETEEPSGDTTEGTDTPPASDDSTTNNKEVESNNNTLE